MLCKAQKICVKPSSSAFVKIQSRWLAQFHYPDSYNVDTFLTKDDRTEERNKREGAAAD